MSSSTNVEVSPPSLDKGKRRAQDTEPTERTPLLNSQSSSVLLDSHDPPPAVARRRLRSKLTTVFLVSLVITTLGAIGVGILAWTYASRASHISTDDILTEGLVFRGPDRVDVLSISPQGGIALRVGGRLGFDAGAVLGVSAESDDTLFGDIWKAVGRWGIRRLNRVAVNMSTIALVAGHVVLATVEPSPVVIPLTASPPSDSSWLTPISMPLLIRPTTNTTALIEFVRESWRDGWAVVRADVSNVDVRGGFFGEGNWRAWLHKQLSDVKTQVRIEIPPIPGLPHGPLPRLSDLITLQYFSLHSTERATLELNALATVPNPAPPSFNLTSPSLPFTIALPSNISMTGAPIASVSTLPFTLTHPNISLAIQGNVLPLSTQATPLLSTFLSRYLSRQNNPILVSTPLIEGLSIDLEFPAPNPPPQVLRNVTIHDMSIKPSGTVVTASGTVDARIVLPKGMDLKLHVGRVFADVLVFDGEVPDGAEFPSSLGEPDEDDEHPLPPAPPLPSPLPPHAFARIRPEEWLPSQSGPVELSDSGSLYAISAHLVDVPLEVLPGRQKEFSGFVSKVVFGSGDGATAGILGVGAVGVEVAGLELQASRAAQAREMELTGLPFRGSVLVGKKAMRRGGLLGLDVGLGDAVNKSEEELGKVREEVKKAVRRLLGKWT
ncbi:hypothetical protein MIND_01379500 [Mycena indigotica]|uniref:Uncharacterized protein n=1 Tax=Mycena indigotica TaxID=2126181 RepID=A0A8H6VPS1_9AGAR|nr:uncharacterized protein MIND_01379500 [Mycena indigotica]KAF7289184.1 hypothetical protein MIND_01379500 [Mycena indigotica]